MYRVEIKKQVQKQLDRVPPEFRARFARAFLELAVDPRRKRPGLDCRKTKGDDAWRVRVGSWRILYEIDDVVLVVEVTRIGRQPAVYS